MSAWARLRQVILVTNDIDADAAVTGIVAVEVGVADAKHMSQRWHDRLDLTPGSDVRTVDA